MEYGLLPDMGNNLRALRRAKEWTHERAAAEMGVSRSQFIKLERGERRLTSDYIAMAAKAFSVDEADIFAEPKSVPLVGYVGAGAEAYLFGEGQGPFEEVPAPEGATEATVAVEVRGESLGALFDRWLVFYDDIRDPVTDDLIGKLCVCGLADGRVLVKQLRRGQLEGHFHLFSNTAPPLYDQVVLWAARVRQMTPR